MQQCLLSSCSHILFRPLVRQSSLHLLLSRPARARSQLKCTMLSTPCSATRTKLRSALDFSITIIIPPTMFMTVTSYTDTCYEFHTQSPTQARKVDRYLFSTCSFRGTLATDVRLSESHMIFKT
ncbi:hypothetical protein MPTK1_2g04790 [Marchantia polymorpha subsp. ruderalis]|uniref:Uncharacterized protein n=1 Tax=Marchantia polymorpha TaxID=3197 RepID=A0A2R6X7U5_MARPO|nr:hypothetical protein MARPO_0031s0134 [Marchantia polymorpha]BBN01118.1 hypothetical protein Mp_2g04790 [Marchantia polymorpha subsp. ruderalis]|eukprot:PTQ42167.1 hypothetical protein MARPO_0031s0134 [Marchantia polymorpha]